MDRKFLDNEFGPDMSLFSRWINRLVHPTKKGTKILAEYAMAPDQPKGARIWDYDAWMVSRPPSRAADA